MKTYAERLKWSMDRVGMNQSQFASEVSKIVKNEVKPQTIQYLCDPKKNARGSKYTPVFAMILGVNPIWLANNDGDPLQSLNAKQESSENDYSLIPIFDVHASCGNDRFNDQIFIEGGFTLPKKMLREIGVSEANGRIIHATGDSMSPTIQKDAVVLINLADTELRDGRIYAISTPHEGLVLKRLIHEYNGSLKDYVWIMRSDNPDKDNHPDKQLPPDKSTIIIGRAVWTDRKL